MSEPASSLAEAPHDAQDAPADDPLRAFLSGKRQGERYACHVAATLEGALAPVAATVLDVSATGVLLQIDDAAFVEAEQNGGAQAYFELLSLQGRDGLRLVLDGHDLTRRVEMVRWTAGEAGQGASRLGMRFDAPLSEAELDALRTGRTAALGDPQGPAAPAAERLPWVPRRRAAPQLLVFRADQPEMGPVVAGRVLGAGPRGLALRVDGERPLLDVAGLLAGHPLAFHLVERGVPRAQGLAEVAWILPVEGAAAVDLGLALEAPLPKAAARRFRAG